MRYATVYGRKRSPFWYLAYLDAKTGKRFFRATTHRRDDPAGRRHAHEEALQLSKSAVASHPSTPMEAWECWVEPWLAFKYNASALTRTRYLTAWGHLRSFMSEEGIRTPRGFKYLHVERYLVFRTSQLRHRGTPVNHNTAVTELKVLSVILHEAVLKGYADHNCVIDAKLGRQNVREKPEMTSEEIAMIREKLKAEPSWMTDCFEIALHQGCRLTEVQVPLRDVRVGQGTILFRGKGGKVFTTALHPAVAAIAKRRTAEKETILCQLPKMAAKDWHFFFKRAGLPHLCFHCTRVTAITHLARSGVSQQQAMRYIGHASATIHKVYQRLTVEDLGAAVVAMGSIGTNETP